MSSLDFAIKSSKDQLFRLSNVAVYVPELPEAFENYRIVQLSDFHYGPTTPAGHLRSAISITRALKPDLLLFTGDYITAGATGYRNIFARQLHPKVVRWTTYRRTVRRLAQQFNELISPLAPPDGIVGVFGNHDHLEGIGTIIRQLGDKIHWLNNQSLVVRRHDVGLQIIGIDDLHRGKPNLEHALEADSIIGQSAGEHDLDTSLDYAKSLKPFLKILLSHNPDIVIHPTQKRHLESIHLILSGHTHGGQIRLPLLGPIVTHTQQRQHVRGLSRADGRPIYVSSGIGYGLIQLRLFCPPEIVVFNLKRAAQRLAQSDQAQSEHTVSNSSACRSPGDV